MSKDLSNAILFLHAFIGCNTSRLFGIWKTNIIKKLQDNSEFRQACNWLTLSDNPNDIANAGERVLLLLYSGKTSDSLTTLRCTRFREKTALRTSYVQCKSLTPKSAAAHYQSLRVHHHLKGWTGININPDRSMVLDCTTAYGNCREVGCTNKIVNIFDP